MSSDNTNTNNSSTLKSYADSATGMAQRAMGSITGDSSYKTQGSQTQDQATQEHTNSHTAAKLGPVTADPNTGAISTDHPQRRAGNWDQTLGSAKESLGNLTGYEGLRQAGVEQNQRGKEAEAEGQLRDLGEGAADRVSGGLGKVKAVVSGDREAEERAERMHDEGKVRQRGAEADIQERAV